MPFKVLLIGESCTDIFQYGEVKRLCPESPVPVFNPTHSTTNEGMAANVLANLKSLDSSMKIDFITNEDKPVKTRFVETKSNHLIVRVDINDSVAALIDGESYDNSEYDAVVVSDYNKGFLSKDDIFNFSNGCKISFLDTKKPINDFANSYDFIKINRQELINSEGHYMPIDFEDNLIVTLGDEGCVYKGVNYPVKKSETLDVSGAGDSFFAALVVSYLHNKDIVIAIQYANEKASEVVKRKGVSVM